MLVAGGVVVADEGHLPDVHGEQVKPPRLGMPAQRGRHRAGVAAPDIEVVLGTSPAADLEVPLPAVAAGRAEADTTPPAELTYFANFAATVLP